MITKRRSFAAAMVVVVAGFMAGCEDSPLFPGDDWVLSVEANPGTVTLDPQSGTGTALIIATIVNADGVPQFGIPVTFTANGGLLASGGEPVETDAGGQARDTLTVQSSDPDTVLVTGMSGALKASKEVKTVGGNHPPQPVIAATPVGAQNVGGTVTFSGVGTTDPDSGDVVTMFKWVVTSRAPDSNGPAVPVGPPYEEAGLSSITFPSADRPVFDTPAELTVELSVTDDVNAPAIKASGGTVTYRATTAIGYSIVQPTCPANQAPVADLAGTAVLVGVQGEHVTAFLDGSLSDDPDGDIETYQFECGNGAPPQVTGATAVCEYTVQRVSRNYTATLKVQDDGNGSVACMKTSTLDTVMITVSPQ